MLSEEDKRTLEKYRNSIHKTTPAEERDTYIRALLTSKFYPSFKDTPREMSDAFMSLNLEPDTTKSYFVYGATEEILYKFAAFYIINGNRNFTMHFVKELTELLTNRTLNPDDAPLFRNDLLIIYNHKHITAMGAQQDLYYSTVINRVVERNRRNLPTLILSEIKEPRYEESGELEVVNLGVLLNNKNYNPAPAVKAIPVRKVVTKTVSNNSTYSIPETQTTSGYYNNRKKHDNGYLNSYKERKEQE